MSANGKDTIYIDIDDEITGIIDKVQNSSEKIVALVLPKRATVFQSIVNMKLLKRSADNAKKHVVLITSEAGLMPLAATVGLRVAKTLQSKPEVPVLEEIEEEDDTPMAIEGPDKEITTENAGNRPIGELAGKVAVPAAIAGAEEIETLDLDDTADDTVSTASADPAAANKAKGKKLHIPNFDKFRLRLVLGVLILILIIVGLFLANSILPKANIVVSTNTSAINSNQTLTLDSTAKSLDMAQLTVPAQVQQDQKTNSQQVPTTGQQNNGQKADGTITMTAKECFPNLGSPDSVPAGTGVSANGVTYITQDSTKFSNSGVISGSGSNTCATYQSIDSTDIAAQSAGAKYNIDSGTFTVAGRPDVSGSGSADGGTDNIVKVVAQADIDSATKKITDQDTSAIKKDLQQKLEQAGLYAITATLNAGTPTTTTSANVGGQADTVTVTEVTTYTMLGVKQSDLKQVVDNDVKEQIDTSKQSILDEGLKGATFRVITSSGTGAQVAMSAVATAGPDLNVNDLKKQVEGKKSGDVVSFIKDNPGVTNVKVDLSPFWVNTVPKNPDKITITFDKTVTHVKSNANSAP